MPATVDVKELNSTFHLKAVTKFFPHLSTEASPLKFFLNGVEKVITSLLANLTAGIEEGKNFLIETKYLISLDLYSVELV